MRVVGMLYLAFSTCISAQELVFSAKVMGPVSNIATYSDKGEIKRVTDNIRWRDMDADISSSGAVVFSSNREENTAVDINRRSESFDIYLAAGSGAPLRRLTDTPQSESIPRFSPGGHRVAYVQERNTLWLQELEGSDLEVNSAEKLFSAEEVLDFDWSPDGSHLAVAVRDEASSKLLLLGLGEAGDVAAKTLQVFPRNESDAESDCARCGSVVSIRWSPDQRQIALILHPERHGVRSLWRMPVEVTTASGDENIVRVSSVGQQVQSPVNWSSDGQSLLYSALVNYRFYYDESVQRKVYEGGMQVFRTQPGSEPVSLTSAEGAAKSPVFFGREKIAYLQADGLGARTYALVIHHLGDGSTQRVFDQVSGKSSLTVSR